MPAASAPGLVRSREPPTPLPSQAASGFLQLFCEAPERRPGGPSESSPGREAGVTTEKTVPAPDGATEVLSPPPGLTSISGPTPASRPGLLSAAPPALRPGDSKPEVCQPLAGGLAPATPPETNEEEGTLKGWQRHVNPRNGAMALSVAGTLSGCLGLIVLTEGVARCLAQPRLLAGSPSGCFPAGAAGQAGQRSPDCSVKTARRHVSVGGGSRASVLECGGWPPLSPAGRAPEPKPAAFPSTARTRKRRLRSVPPRALQDADAICSLEPVRDAPLTPSLSPPRRRGEGARRAGEGWSDDRRFMGRGNRRGSCP